MLAATNMYNGIKTNEADNTGHTRTHWVCFGLCTFQQAVCMYNYITCSNVSRQLVSIDRKLFVLSIVGRLYITIIVTYLYIYIYIDI